MRLRNFSGKHPLLTFIITFLLVEAGLNTTNTLYGFLDNNLAELVGLIITALLSLGSMILCASGVIRFRKITKNNFGSILRDFIFAAYIVFIAHLIFVIFAFANRQGISLVSSSAIDDEGIVSLLLTNIYLLAELLADAFLTAITEDCLFIGIGFLCLRNIFITKRKSNVRAILITAILFGLCHVLGIVSNPTSYMDLEFSLIVLLCGLKFIQTSLFAICLVFLFVRTSSIVSPILVHTAFDFFYFLIPCLLTKKLPELFIESGGFIPSVEILTLVGSIALLIPAVLYVKNKGRRKDSTPTPNK